MLLPILSLVLALWIFIGVALYLLVGRNPKAGRRPILRGVDRRLCVVGDTVEVTLACSANGLPRVASDEKLTPRDIVLVIDHSSSMGSGIGSSLYEARKAAINLVRTTPDSFRFSVVEFDHEAREVCPLTERHTGLVRAIEGIGRGGATDIALGLQVADKSLERAEAVDDRCRRALLLLSDGGSDADAAIAAADALKRDAELQLITVGIGAADMPLLRRLASTPDHCFHADQIDDLAALYAEIGRMMTGCEATEVKVTEHFSATGRWGLRGWGELHPSAFDLRDGEFAWLLAALQEQPVELHYSVEALCAGWQSVAPEPAQLRARTGDGSLHEPRSNAGPRVLVLPGIPGWQLLWLLLNPLWFLLFGKLHRCKEVVVARREPVIPPARELHLPPLLEAVKAREPPLSVRPTLVIGLGYAGIHALVHSKRLAWERADRFDLDQLRFLAIDTADELFFPSPRAGLVTLDAHERITLDHALEPIIAAEANARDPRHPWLDAASLSAGGARPDLHRGSGHQRALARLALLENRAALEARVGPLLDALIARAGSAGMDILVSAGSGGGTGGGALLDLCWLLRHLLDERDYRGSSTTLFLSAPHARQALDTLAEERAMRQANHRALLAELDRFSTQRGELLSPAPELPPLRRWIDRVFFIGPAAHDTWRAEEVLYPKTGEAMFTWLASDESGGLRAHFVEQDAANNDYTRRLGRCLVHRADPVSHYLYPRSLRTYLVIDTLRRTLANRLWDLDERNFAEYSADACKPDAAPALLQAWLGARPEGTDYPWVFSALSALGDPTRLQQSLNRGAGPEISGGISPLARNELFDEQRKLVRAVLDGWLLDTLNQGNDGVCDAHALALCIHALRELHRRLREGSEIAAHLVVHSSAPMVRREAETVAELATQAFTETETLIRRLGDWDRRLGEGSEGGGLMRLLDERSGRLRVEIEALRDADSGSGTPRSPRLPLDWEQIDALPERFLASLGEQLAERIGWSIERVGSRLHLHLHLQGTSARHWSLEQLGLGDAAIVDLADAFIQVGAELSSAFDGWRLADHESEGLPDLRVERPRSEQLNPGARGLYLTQGQGRFNTSAHVEQIPLKPFDSREARIIGCEEHLASERLWPERPAAEAPPFVFIEERNAYRGYHAYCRAENREPEPLAPTLVGLCRDPRALLGFALEGLANGSIHARDDGLRQTWTVRDLPGLERPIDIAQQDDNPLVAFQRVANGWLGAGEPALRRFEASQDEAPDALAGRIASHELAAAIGDEPWYEQFVAVVWGLLRWY